jgi:hypothetical protein
VTIDVVPKNERRRGIVSAKLAVASSRRETVHIGDSASVAFHGDQTATLSF